MTYVPFYKFKNWCQNVSSKFNRHTTQLNGLYFAKNSDGKWGYKTSIDGNVTPFQDETIHTQTYDLGNNNNGSMIDMGIKHKYRYIKANGLYTLKQYNDHYNQGVTDADNRTNTNSTNYKSGYNAGVSAADNRENQSSVSYKNGYNNGRTQGHNDVTGNPNGYGLYTKSQYDANYNSGYNQGKGESVVFTNSINLKMEYDGRDNDGNKVRSNVTLYAEYQTSKNGVTIVGTNTINYTHENHDRDDNSGRTYGPGKDYYGNSWYLVADRREANWQGKKFSVQGTHLYKNGVKVADCGDHGHYCDVVLYRY